MRRKQPERFFALAKRSPFCDFGAMKWILYTVGFIALVIGVTFLIGYALPARTTISRSINLQQTPEAVFAVLADVRRMAEWNRNTEKVEMLPSVGGKEATKQSFKGGMVMTIITAESSAAASSRAHAGRCERPVRRFLDLRDFAGRHGLEDRADRNGRIQKPALPRDDANLRPDEIHG